MPFIILSVLMTVVGTFKDPIDKIELGPVKTYYQIHMPYLDKQVIRTPPVVEKTTAEPAIFKFNWVTTPGTSVFFTVIDHALAAFGSTGRSFAGSPPVP